jgi:hypothetical protein
MNFSEYTSLYYQNRLCGSILGYKGQQELPKGSGLVALTACRKPSREDQVYDAVRTILRWAKQVGRADADIIVVLLVQHLEDGDASEVERLGIGIMFWTLGTDYLEPLGTHHWHSNINTEPACQSRYRKHGYEKSYCIIWTSRSVDAYQAVLCIA